MKMLYRIGILCVAAMLLVACGSDKVDGNGKSTTITRGVPTFNQIKINGAYKLSVTVGGQQSVRIMSDSNIVPLVMTTVKNGLLTVSNKPGVSFNVSKPVFIQIMVRNLKNITASGANKINASRISSDEFTLETSGAVQANLSGTASKVSIQISGSGNVNADRLIAKEVKIRLNGSGHILVNASQKLDSKINGSGSIIYTGNPSDVDQSITGSGKIERLR